MALVQPDRPKTGPSVYAGDDDRLDSIGENGTVPVPDDPGLGVDDDWDDIEDRATGRRVYE